MAKFFTFILITLFSANIFSQNKLSKTKANKKSFPTNINAENFNKLENFDGEIISYDGIIEKIENSRNNTPFYKLKIEESKYLWTVLMFKNDKNVIGDKIRVVGYLRPSKPNDIEKKYLNEKFMVLSFGLVDFKNSNFLFLEGAEIQKKEWINGKIPSSN